MSAAASIPARVADQEIRHKRVWSWTQPWVYLVALVACAITIGPVIWLAVGGFRTNDQLLNNPAGFPAPFIGSNYLEITSGVFATRFWGMVATSTIIALGTTLLVVVLGTSVAYAIGRFQMRGKSVLFSLFAAGLMFPATIGILPTWVILNEIGLIGNPLGVIITQVAFAMPTTVVILTPFVRAIPNEIEEAASIDGAGRVGFFFRILLPLARPGMVTVGVLAFVGSWNAFMLPLFVLQIAGVGDHALTLPLGVQMFQTRFSNDMTSIMAFTMLASIPALIFFLAMQKYIVNGLSGAVKG